MIQTDIEALMNMIDSRNPDILIVEGYDGTGKGRIIKEIVRRFKRKIYRPDYAFWNEHIKTEKRWMISRAFFELVNLVGIEDKLVLDRSMVSGAVYASNVDVAKDMSKLIKDLDVMHILITTDRDSFYKMQGVRLGQDIPRKPYALCKEYTERYHEYFTESGIEYYTFHNEFNNKVGHKNMGKCGGCDNWNTLRQDYDTEKLVGYCSHWEQEFLEDSEKCPFYEKGDVHAR